MNKKRRKRLIALAACLVICLGCMPVCAADAATGTADNSGSVAQNPYVYRYEGASTETSSHHFTFQWMRGDTPWEKVRNRYLSANIFQLVNTGGGETELVYCADFLTTIASGTDYRRINLEDSTYYNDTAAAHIRGIVQKGYWHDWTSADLASAEAAANNWLEAYGSSGAQTGAYLPGDAEEEVEAISGLTSDQALLATQLAIWAFANTEGDGYWIKFYESFATDQSGVYDYAELPNNVKAFRKYLLHQQSVSLAPEDIVFSDQYFVTDSVIFSGKIGESSKYDLTVKVKLAAPVDERDELTLTAKLADRDVESFPITGEDALVPDAGGYYSIRLTGVTQEEADAGLTLTINGYQYTEGVYFYEAEPTGSDSGRETSQNLVGKAQGMTAVLAEADLDIDLGSRTVTLYKVDSETQEHLPGAEFELYAEKDGMYQLVFEGLVTDENGKIAVGGLPEGYEYYFKETKAPDGYEITEDGYIEAKESDGDEEEPIYVNNTRQKEELPGPEDGTIKPGDPGDSSHGGTHRTGDDFNMEVYLALMVAGLLAMIMAAVRLRNTSGAREAK